MGSDGSWMLRENTCAGAPASNMTGGVERGTRVRCGCVGQVRAPEELETARELRPVEKPRIAVRKAEPRDTDNGNSWGICGNWHRASSHVRDYPSDHTRHGLTMLRPRLTFSNELCVFHQCIQVMYCTFHYSNSTEHRWRTTTGRRF